MRLAPLSLAALALVLGSCGDDPASPDGAPFTLGSQESRAADYLVLGGQPTEARIAEVVAAGFERIVSLNPPAKAPSFDEAAAVKAAGAEYIHLALSKEALFGDASLREQGYALLAKLEASRTKTYMHCSSSNRVAALWAMYQVERHDMPAEQALAEGKRLGVTKLEPLLRKHLGLASE